MEFLGLSGSNSAGRVRPCQGRCRGFESRLPLHRTPSPVYGVHKKVVTFMKTSVVLLFAACGLVFGQDYKMESGGAPPSDLPPAFASLMSPQGYKITGPGGSVYCEIWFRSSLPSGKKSSEESVAFPTIPHGSLIGAIRFPAQAADRRGQQL